MTVNEMRVENRALYLVDERMKTFKNWPFDNKNRCNVRNMAEAGFYSVATGDDDADAAKCFLCGKELDGWEPDDDPWSEHKSHAAKCAFVQLGKKQDDLLMSEFLSVVKQYMINELKQYAETFKELMDEKTKAIAYQQLSGKLAGGRTRIDTQDHALEEGPKLDPKRNDPKVPLSPIQYNYVGGALVCGECGRTFRAKIGYVSHQRAHQRRSREQQGVTVVDQGQDGI